MLVGVEVATVNSVREKREKSKGTLIGEVSYLRDLNSGIPILGNLTRIPSCASHL